MVDLFDWTGSSAKLNYKWLSIFDSNEIREIEKGLALMVS